MVSANPNKGSQSPSGEQGRACPGQTLEEQTDAI